MDKIGFDDLSIPLKMAFLVGFFQACGIVLGLAMGIISLFLELVGF